MSEQKNKGGRPRIPIDKDQFEKLCALMCTQEEIADFFNCSADTVSRWCEREVGCGFADAYKKYSAQGKISLRRNQFVLSKKSAAMAIFLGKNYLGQTDHVEIQDTAALDKLDEILKGARDNALQQETE